MNSLLLNFAKEEEKKTTVASPFKQWRGGEQQGEGGSSLSSCAKD